jgi:hypothetical protein
VCSKRWLSLVSVSVTIIAPGRNVAVTPDADGCDMNMAASEALVLRAWVESTGEPRLRVRLVRISPGRAERLVLSTTSVEDACAAVRSWLVGFEQLTNSSDS